MEGKNPRRRGKRLFRPADWDALRFSCPGGNCPPAPHNYFVGFLSCENSPLILVGVRRKSDRAEPSEADPQKVSLKIDVNFFVPGQEFFGKKKLSLEAGGGGSVVTEGMSWRSAFKLRSQRSKRVQSGLRQARIPHSLHRQ